MFTSDRGDDTQLSVDAWSMSGAELHEWLVETSPRLADEVVFITGGAFTPKAREYLTKVGNLRFEKPFDAVSMKRMVNELVIASRRKK